MTTQRKRSKRRCGGNTRRKRRRPNPTFLFDQCLGSRRLAEAYVAQGCKKILLLADKFPVDADDQVWLAEAGRRRWVVLTKDRLIRKRRLELLAVHNSKARVFVLSGGNLSAADLVDAFVAALPKILKICHQRGPFIATVTPAGAVSLASRVQLEKWLGGPRKT